MKCIIYVIALYIFTSSTSLVSAKTRIKYQPVWASLDTRPLPSWFFKAKIGILIHWGIYSVPAFGVNDSGSEWFFYMWKKEKHGLYQEFINKNYGSNFTYRDFDKYFTANKFSAREWAKLFKEAGARYVILTSKHHDGFTLWPSSQSTWRAVDVGPRRDLLGELATAVRQEGLYFGVYYSLMDWQSPDYEADVQSEFATTTFVDNVVHPELKELVEMYKPDILWVDGDWEASHKYWKSTYFLAWLYNHSPVRDTIVVNDRWGVGTRNKHGDFMVDIAPEEYDIYHQRHLEQRVLCVKLDRYSYGYQAHGDIYYRNVQNIKSYLAVSVNRGANVLLNIGATKDGEIVTEFKNILKEFGSWLKDIRQAIYNTVPKKLYESDEFCTMPINDTNTVYASFHNWPTKIMASMYTSANASGITMELLGGNLLAQYDKVEEFYKLAPLKEALPPPYVIKITNIC